MSAPVRLYVGNLPLSADERQIRELLGQDGRTVVEVTLPVHRATRRPQGFAYVDMASQEEADAAIRALDRTLFGGYQLTVADEAKIEETLCGLEWKARERLRALNQAREE